MSNNIAYARSSAHDDHYTPKSAMEPLLKRFDFSSATIWEPCAGNGAIERCLCGVANRVIATDIVQGLEYDIRTAPMPDDAEMVVTNPPFSIKRQIIERFVSENIPFALLLPLSTMCEKWYEKVAPWIQVVPIYGRIKFIGHKHTAPFYTAWFVFRIWERGEE